MNFTKKVSANIVGYTIPILVSLVTVPIYLRIIGDEVYGVLILIWAVIGYLGFLDFGMGSAIAVKISNLDKVNFKNNEDLVNIALSTSLALGFFFGIIFASLSELILCDIIESKEICQNINCLSLFILLIIPLQLGQSVIVGVFQGLNNFKKLNFIVTVAGILLQIIPLLIAYFNFKGLDDLLFGIILAKLLTFIYAFYECKKAVNIKVRLRFNKKVILDLINFGGWVATMNFCAPLLVTIDRLLISSVLGAREVTIYSIPSNLITKLTIINSSISSVLLPSFASEMNDEINYRNAKKNSILIGFIIYLLCIVAIFLIYPFTKIWINSNFAKETLGVSLIIIIGVWVNSIAVPFHTKLVATGKARIITIAYIFEIPIYVALLYYGMKSYGVIGAAIAWSLRIVLDTFMILLLNKVEIYFFIVSAIALLTLCYISMGVWNIIILSEAIIPSYIVITTVILFFYIYLFNKMVKNEM